MMSTKQKLAVAISAVFLYALLRAPAPDPLAPADDGAGAGAGGARVDDWVYGREQPGMDAEMAAAGGFGVSGGMRNKMAQRGMPQPAMMGAPAPQAMAMAAMPESSSTLGFAVGGAKDVSNFRENVEQGYLPQAADITYEGLFYDYFFDTGASQPCDDLFCPSFALAGAPDPINGDKRDHFLTVGLNSGMTEDYFERRPLNLVVVLDISGSMSSSFSSYYYGGAARKGARGSEKDKDSNDVRPKIEVAKEAIVGLLGHLEPKDRLGVVLFDHQSYLAKSVNRVDATDMDAIKGHIRELSPRGGTNMQAGMQMGLSLFDDIPTAPGDDYENRLIFLTDAQPNTGDISDSGMLGLARQAADKGRFITFIGIGVDFQTELVEAITKTRGANYFAVHSASDFLKQMDDDFDFMVSPLIFDLELAMQPSPDFVIDKVYGSPEASEATGELIKVKTLFPSRTSEEGTRGGVVLLQLRRTSDNPAPAPLQLTVSYQDRYGNPGESTAQVDVGTVLGGPEPAFANTGIRKAILLTRYANLLRGWVTDQRFSMKGHGGGNGGPGMWDGDADKGSGEGGGDAPVLTRQALISRSTGIIVCPGPAGNDGQAPSHRWERVSMPLAVLPEYADLLTTFREHLVAEKAALGDDELQRELDLLGKVLEKA